MGNHFHLLVRMLPETGFTGEDMRQRFGIALAENAEAIVTHNVRDIRGGELYLGSLCIVTPAQCLEEWR